jgi:hypothetical protein
MIRWCLFLPTAEEFALFWKLFITSSESRKINKTGIATKCTFNLKSSELKLLTTSVMITLSPNQVSKPVISRDILYPS